MKREWATLDKLHAQQYAAGDDGFTIPEYMDRYNLNEKTASARLRRLVGSGALVEGWCVGKGRDGRKIRRRCYRINSVSRAAAGRGLPIPSAARAA